MADDASRRGRATAEQIIATLRRKVTKVALMPQTQAAGEPVVAAPNMDGDVIEDAYRPLMSIGHSPQGLPRLDKVFTGWMGHSRRSRKCCWRFTSKRKVGGMASHGTHGSYKSYGTPPRGRIHGPRSDSCIRTPTSRA